MAGREVVAQVRDAAPGIEERLGPIDVWINNAMTPVPPIFQPETAARAVYWAAHHRRRELYHGHGGFDDQAHPRSEQAWLTQHRSDRVSRRRRVGRALRGHHAAG